MRSDGTKYEGYFVDGKMQGQGKSIHKGGNIYIGNFINNKFNGYGQL